MMTLYIYESNPSGHRLVYVRVLAERAVELGWDVELLLSQKVLESIEYSLHIASVLAPVGIAVHRADALPTRTVLKRRSRLIVPDFDALGFHARLTLIGLGNDSRVLVMNDPKWIAGQTGRRAFRRVLKRLTLWAFSRMPGVRVFYLRPPRLDGKYSSNEVMDPVLIDLEQVLSRPRDRRLAADTFWFGIVGGINDRKNFELVARAITSAAPSTGVKLGLALIGLLSPEARTSMAGLAALLRDAGCGFVVEDRVLTNDEMNTAIASLDCIALAYSSNAPNSTTVKAGALGIPVLAAGSTVFLDFVSEAIGAAGYALEHRSLVIGILDVVESPRREAIRFADNTCFTDPLVGPPCSS